MTSIPQVVQEFRRRSPARHQQMIARTSAGDVKQVPFRVVDLFQIRVVGDGFDPFLQGNDLIVTGHYRDSAKLQPFREMHGADRRSEERRVGKECRSRWSPYH